MRPSAVLLSYFWRESCRPSIAQVCLCSFLGDQKGAIGVIVCLVYHMAAPWESKVSGGCPVLDEMVLQGLL